MENEENTETSKQEKFALLNWTRTIYEGFVDMLIWLILLAFVIGGAVIGWNSGNDSEHLFFSIIGLVVGTGLGLITVILSFGLIAEFLSIGRDLKAVREELVKLRAEKSRD